MRIGSVEIVDTHAEGFAAWAARVIITAVDETWVGHAAAEVIGYGASLIGCDAEVGIERRLSPAETPDGRPGVAVLFFTFKPEPLCKALVNRVGQCVLTCPTTAAFDGLPEVRPPEGAPDTLDAHNDGQRQRIPLGGKLRYFGDGFERHETRRHHGREEKFWLIPVMDGEFGVSDSIGVIRGVAGGNFLICGRGQRPTLLAAQRAVAAIAPLPDVITPFPGGVVRSGSKVGSRYRNLVASTNEVFCPTLRQQVMSQLPTGVDCVYEIVIDGLSYKAVADAMRAGIVAACADGGGDRANEPEAPGEVAISAGNYGGKLGKQIFSLRQIMSGD